MGVYSIKFNNTLVLFSVVKSRYFVPAGHFLYVKQFGSFCHFGLFGLSGVDFISLLNCFCFLKGQILFIFNLLILKSKCICPLLFDFFISRVFRFELTVLLVGLGRAFKLVSLKKSNYLILSLGFCRKLILKLPKGLFFSEITRGRFSLYSRNLQLLTRTVLYLKCLKQRLYYTELKGIFSVGECWEVIKVKENEVW